MSLRIEGDGATTILRVAANEPGVLIQGMDPAAAIGFLGQGPRVGAWTGREREILCSTTNGDSSTESSRSEYGKRVDAPDGTTWLASGKPARVVTGSRYEEPVRTGPRSLAIAVAQQWARVGGMTLHAAGFRLYNMNWLLVGDRGAGKSTACLSAAAAGAQILSDDWILVRRSKETKIHAISLRRRMLVRQSDAATALMKRLRGLRYNTIHGRTKVALDLPDEINCSEMKGIDRVVFLERPRSSRNKESTVRSEHPASRSAGLMAASTPLFHSRQFDVERRQLQQIVKHLIFRPGGRIVSGTEIVDHPEAFWTDLAKFMTDQEKGQHIAGLDSATP